MKTNTEDQPENLVPTTIAAVSAGPAEQAGEESLFVEGPRLSFGFCSLSCFTCQPCAGTEAVLPLRGSCRMFGPPAGRYPVRELHSGEGKCGGKDARSTQADSHRAHA